MRTTIHLVTSRDCLRIRPLLQPVLDRGFRTGSPFGRKLAGVDIDAVLAAGEAALQQKPATGVELAAILGKQWPDFDAESLAQAVRMLVPLVQIPPRGIWGKGGLPVWAPAETWLAKQLDESYSIDDLALRYLGAFGPAGVLDFQAWSWLARQSGTFERLRPRLITFRDESERELFDLPDAPRPPEDVPAPVRFIPEYDNLLLSHADRSRVVTEAELKRVFARGGLLVDGFAAGAWKIVRTKGRATLEVELFRKLTKKDERSVQAEGRRLLNFAAAEAKSQEVSLAPA
jgi:hypothetical protein